MNKPHIRFFEGLWFCLTDKAVGVSHICNSPAGAYWSAVAEG